MRNLLFVLVMASTLMACKKEVKSPAVAVAASNSVEGAVVISSGDIIFSQEGNKSGRATIYLRKDGVYVLALEQMDYRSNFDLNVYLSPSNTQTNASLKIFSAKTFAGNMYYELPAGLSLAALQHVLLQKDTQANATASAFLHA